MPKPEQSISIEKEIISTLQGRYKDGKGRLEISPEIQRHSVWTPSKRAKLIDSILRGLPIGSITLYCPPVKPQQWEVIDGKQRLMAIFDYISEPPTVLPDDPTKDEIAKAAAEHGLSDDATEKEIRNAEEHGKGFLLDPVLIQKNEDSEIVDINDDSVKPYLNKSFTSLPATLQETFLDYKLPVVEVEGSRESTVQVFTRMNSLSFILNEQEIRNALFCKFDFLPCIRKLNSDFQEHTNARHSGLIALGTLSVQRHNRMHSDQIMSELLIYALERTQHRHDRINRYYRVYGQPHGKEAEEREAKSELILKTLKRIWKLTGGETLADGLNMDQTPAEEQLYALSAALLKPAESSGKVHQRFSKRNFDNNYEDLASIIKDLMVDVSLYEGLMRTSPEDSHDGTAEGIKKAIEERAKQELRLDPEAREYYNSFKSQKNSLSNRVTRINILRKKMDELIPSVEQEHFSVFQKRYIWALNVRRHDGTAQCKRKDCKRESRDVLSREYHCGHVVAKANEGRAVLSNGQVEHKGCNLSASDRKD